MIALLFLLCYNKAKIRRIIMFFEYLKNFDDYSLFSTAHILYIIFCIAIAIILAIVLRKLNSKHQRIVGIVIASVVITLHIATQVWRAASFADGRSKGIIESVAYLVMPNEILPFQLCSMLCFLIPICVMLNKQWMYNALAPICVIAGFLYFFFPDGIINRYPPFSFRVLESMLVHTAILFYGIYLFTSKKVVFKLKNMREVFASAAVLFGIAIIMNVIITNFDPNVDFFYMMKGFGLGLHPAVNAIIIALVGTALFFAVYGICQLCYKLSAIYQEKKQQRLAVAIEGNITQEENNEKDNKK